MPESDTPNLDLMLADQPPAVAPLQLGGLKSAPLVGGIAGDVEEWSRDPEQFLLDQDTNGSPAQRRIRLLQRRDTSTILRR